MLVQRRRRDGHTVSSSASDKRAAARERFPVDGRSDCICSLRKEVVGFAAAGRCRHWGDEQATYGALLRRRDANGLHLRKRIVLVRVCKRGSARGKTEQKKRMKPKIIEQVRT